MVKLQYSKQNKRFHLTVPGELVESKHWKKGQRLLLAFNAQGNIEIRELEETPKKNQP